MKKIMIGTVATLILTLATGTAMATQMTIELGTASPTTKATANAAPKEETLRLTFGDPFADVSGLAVSREEATRTGMNALAKFYGISAEEIARNFTSEVYYNPPMDPLSFLNSPFVDFNEATGTRIDKGTVRDNTPDEFFPMDVYKGMWHGSLFPSNRAAMIGSAEPMIHSQDTFRFSVCAKTGELLGLQYFISVDPSRKTNQKYDNFPSPIAVFEYAHNMTSKHNGEYAKHAMKVAEEMNLLEGKVRRAAIIGGGWMPGKNSSFELHVFTVVESVNGEVVQLAFQGKDRKELTDVNFLSRKIDYAVNKDGSKTKPVHNFVGNPNSLYNFGWVYR